MRIFIHIIWIFWLSLTLASAEPVPSGQANAALTFPATVETVRFRSFGQNSGLPQATVSKILQDRAGYMWFGTQAGLSRFDGYRFQNYVRGPNGLADNYVISMALDGLDQLWISTQGPVLTVMDLATERFTQLPVSVKNGALSSDDFIASMLVVNGDHLLLSTRRSGVISLNTKTRQFLDTAIPKGTVVKALSQLTSGEIAWFVDGSIVLTDQNFANQRVFSNTGAASINDIEPDLQGGYWLASSDKGLLRIDGTGKLLASLQHSAADPASISDNYCRTLKRDSRGQLWIATSNGLNRLQANQQRFDRWRSETGDIGSLPGNRISDLLEDRDGQLWVGTWTGGPAVHDLRASWVGLIQKTQGNARALPSNQISSIVVNSDNTIWAALVDSAGMARFDLQAGLIAQHRRSDLKADTSQLGTSKIEIANLPGDDVSAVSKSRDGGVWVGTLRTGGARLDATGKLVERLNASTLPADQSGGFNGISGLTILKIHENAKGDLWIGTLNAGLNYRCASCATFRQFRHAVGDKTSIPGDTSTAILEAKNGDFWFGFRRGGLARYVPNESRFERYQNDPARANSLAHTSVSSIIQDVDGRIWVGTQSGGISIMNRPPEDSFSHITTADGLPSDTSACFIADAQNNIWLSMTGGVVRFDGASSKDLGSGKRSVFRMQDGIQGQDFFTESCARGPDGLLYFGALHGITVIDPGRLPGPRISPSVTLTDVQFGNRSLSPVSGELSATAANIAEIAVPFKERLFGVSFSSLNYLAPDSVRFRHRLKGFTDDWTEVDASRRFVSFTNLPAGQYQLEIGASLAPPEFGKSRMLRVNIEESPWLSSAAIACYVGLAGLFAALIIWPIRARWREREIANTKLEHNAQKLKLVLTTSGCELWDIDIKEQRLIRYSELQTLGLRSPEHGLKVSEFIQYLHDEDRAGFLDRFDRYLKGEGESFEAVYRVRALGGRYRWLRSRGYRAKNSRVSGTTIDITDIKNGELQLQKLNAALEAQLSELEAARAAISETENRRKLALWGSGCEFFEANLATDALIRENKIPGLSSNELADTLSSYWPYLHPDDLPAFNKAFIDHVSGVTPFYDVTYRAKHTSGHWVWVQTRGRAVGRNEAGRVVLLAGTNYDVSDLKKQEFALSELAAELEARVKARTQDLSDALDNLKRAQRQLVDTEKMAALGGLVAGVAHEINTPIGISVTAASHLAEQSMQLQRKLESGALKKSDLSEFSEIAQQSSELVLSNLRRASELVRSFKQVAVDQSSEQKRTIELRAYLTDILSALRPMIRKSQHHIHINCADEIHLCTFPGAIYQITTNLVLNAINHAFIDGEVGNIWIQASVNETHLMLDFEDDGVGIPADIRERVFEPFFTTKRGQGGSGLGLHIVFNLVTQVLGGEITVETFLPHLPREGGDPGTAFAISNKMSTNNQMGTRFKIIVPHDRQSSGH